MFAPRREKFVSKSHLLSARAKNMNNNSAVINSFIQIDFLWVLKINFESKNIAKKNVNPCEM